MRKTLDTDPWVTHMHVTHPSITTLQHTNDPILDYSFARRHHCGANR